MTLRNNDFNASELCSRKLWQLVRQEDSPDVTARQLQEAVEELATRRCYMAELARMGKLGGETHQA